jgi:hypothetical protein
MYPIPLSTTMQTRSQTRSVMSNSTSVLSEPRTNTRKNESPRCSPRLSAVTHFHFDEEDTDSSSEYDPNEDPVDIDFDEASTAWRANKRCTGNGCFEYNKNAFQAPKTKHSMRLRSRV